MIPKVASIVKVESLNKSLQNQYLTQFSMKRQRPNHLDSYIINLDDDKIHSNPQSSDSLNGNHSENQPTTKSADDDIKLPNSPVVKGKIPIGEVTNQRRTKRKAIPNDKQVEDYKTSTVVCNVNLYIC